MRLGAIVDLKPPSAISYIVCESLHLSKATLDSPAATALHEVSEEENGGGTSEKHWFSQGEMHRGMAACTELVRTIS